MCFIVAEDKKFNDTAPAADPVRNAEAGRDALVLLFFSCSPISLDNIVSTDSGGYGLQESVSLKYRGEQGRDVRAIGRCLAWKRKKGTRCLLKGATGRRKRCSWRGGPCTGVKEAGSMGKTEANPVGVGKRADWGEGGFWRECSR